MADAITLDLPDLDATNGLAGKLAGLARAGDVIALLGDLGAGKTAFARAFLSSRAGRAIEVPSPTFTLVQTYALGGPTVWHFDLYRLKHPEEAWELGIEEAFAEGISLIEWADRLGDQLPPHLEVVLEIASDTARRASLRDRDGWSARLDRLA